MKRPHHSGGKALGHLLADPRDLPALPRMGPSIRMCLLGAQILLHGHHLPHAPLEKPEVAAICQSLTRPDFLTVPNAPVAHAWIVNNE